MVAPSVGSYSTDLPFPPNPEPIPERDIPLRFWTKRRSARMQSFLKMTGVFLVCFAPGCTQGSSPNTSDAAYQRQLEEFDRQQIEAAEQLEETDQQLQRSFEQSAKFDMLLDRWAKQADRHDALLRNGKPK